MGKLPNCQVGLLALVAGLLVVGCATTNPQQFSRFKGRALKFDVAIYQGIPPNQYAYRTLGHVEGHHDQTLLERAMGESSGYIMSKALEDLASNAKTMGANAVISVRFTTQGFLASRVSYEGEAVIFEQPPL